MKKWTQNMLWLIGVMLVCWFWWNRELSSPKSNASSDPVRLSLQQATLYQYDLQGKQESYLQSEIIERLKNGETHYISPQLGQKISPTSERIITAKQGRQKGEEIFLQQKVIAQERTNEQPTLILKTEQLTYNQREKVAFSDVGVILQTPESQSYADAVKWQINEKLFILKKNIRSVYVPTP